MTTPSTARKAGPFTGNGSQNSWPFTFKVFAAGDIKVTIADTAGAESVLALDSDYTVTLNGNQDTSPGGSVTYLLTDGYKLTVTGDIDYDQGYDIPNGGNFNPIALENQLDRMVMQTQQLAEQMVRAVKVPVTDDGTGELSSALAQGILALGPIADEIEAVADNSANVNAVAANETNITAVAESLPEIYNFADVYLGAKSDDPAVRNDGSALQVGDLYFSTAINGMRAYGNTGWVTAAVAAPVTLTNQSFNGDGTTTVFTLSAAPAFPAALDVFISGIQQGLTTNYDVSGTTLTFVTAPPSGTGNIRVKILSAYAGGVPNNASVTTDKLANDAVTSDKIAAGAVGTSELAADAVTADELANAAVTTDKLADGAVTSAKIAAGAVTATQIFPNAVGSGQLQINGVGTAAIVNGAVIDAKIVTMSASKLTGDIAAARITNALNATGSAPIYACRAWVNFNGTGTVAIRASGNVSSITDNGVGDYTVNFTTAMPDANFSATVGFERSRSSFSPGTYTGQAVATTSYQIRTSNTSGSASDFEGVNINVFR